MTPPKARKLTKALLVEVDDIPPRVGGDGQGLEALYQDPVALKNKPSGGYRKHGFDTYHLSRFNDTDFVQWYGRRRDGYFWPSGNLMKLTPAGRLALSEQGKGN